MSPAPGSNGNGDPGKCPIQRIPASHDYIRRDGAKPKDGRARGPANPGPGEYRRPRRRATAPAAVPFVHLHVHSNFSFLDGGSRIETLVARAAELGQPALALTDHDGLYGAVRLAKACAKAGIKPIFGAEVRVESLLPDEDRRSPREPSADPHHLVLLAETREGYANLCRLRLRRPPGRPRTRATAAGHPRVLAGASRRVSSASRAAGTARSATSSTPDETDDAYVALLCLREIFGSHHLFVELQYFGYEPHQEARAGQRGVPVYEKIRADDDRLRHRTAVAPPGATTVAATTALCYRRRQYQYANSSATFVASWRAAARANPADNHVSPHPPIAAPTPRTDLPRRPSRSASTPPTTTWASIVTAGPGASPASPTASVSPRSRRGWRGLPSSLLMHTMQVNMIAPSI